jgi:hypothetical protein
VLQIVSHGRKGRHTPLQLDQAAIAAIARTVGGTPEVVVKVSGGGRSSEAVRAHLDYIGRHGKLAVETDDGRQVCGKQLGAALVEDWDLDLSRGQYRGPSAADQDRRPKVAHNLVFSMARGTPPGKLLAATQAFAREHFALRHRYAMVLHTDQAHPHVHVVVKAESEDGARLHIRKATLREWRADFARCLRTEGVAANATPAPARGRLRDRKKDAIHHRMRALGAERAPGRASRAVYCTYLQRKLERIARVLAGGGVHSDPGRPALQRAHAGMVADWMHIAAQLETQGEAALARQVRTMAAALPMPVTEDERLAQGLLARAAQTKGTGSAAMADVAGKRR